MEKLILLRAINLATYLFCSILEGRPAPWTTNMCLDKLDILEMFSPQWLHWAGEQGRAASSPDPVSPPYGLLSEIGPGSEWQVIWCLGRFSPLQNTFPQVYDGGKCTKLSRIKKFFVKKYSCRACMILGLCASLQCDCLTSFWRKEHYSRSCMGSRQVVRGPRAS